MTRYSYKVLESAHKTDIIEIGVQCTLDKKYGYHKFRVTLSAGIYPREEIEVWDHVFHMYYVKDNLHPATRERVLRLAREQLARQALPKPKIPRYKESKNPAPSEFREPSELEKNALDIIKRRYWT